MDTLGQLSAEKEDLRVHSQLLVIANNQSLERLSALTDERPNAEKVDELTRLVQSKDFELEEYKVKKIQDETEIIKLRKEASICRNTIDLMKDQLKDKEADVHVKNAKIASMEEGLVEYRRNSLLRLHEANTKTMGLAVALKHISKTHEELLATKVYN